MENIMSVSTQKRDTLATEAKSIIAQAKSDNRDLTQAETKKIGQIVTEIEEINEHTAAVKKADEQYAQIGRTGQPQANGTKGYIDRKSSLTTARKQLGSAFGTKALINGVTPIDVPLFDAPVTLDGKPNRALWDLLPVLKLTSPSYRYLRQTVRENNASVVTPGEVKPTSAVTFEEVTGQLAVIAHLSEPIDTYWAADFPELVTVLGDELVWGLFDKIEQLALNGDGLNGNPRGILQTAGIQTQAFLQDAATTLRAGITNLEMLGYTAGAIVMHPRDWEAMETSKDVDGRYLLDGPVDRAKKTLWGTEVALSTYMEQGTGLVMDTDSVHLMTDEAIRVDATNAHDGGFARNEILVRAEHRAEVAVTRARGVVKATIAGAAG